MPLTFINGSAPEYRGEIFQTSGELLDNLETHLTTAGWVSLQKVPATSLLVKGISDNAHECFVQFVVKDNTSLINGKYLVCRGWLAADLLQGSPDDYHRFTYQENNFNRMWLTADEDSGCLCIYGTNSSCAGLHFGFVDRVDPTDEWAWMIGWIHSIGIWYAYVARAKHNNVVWRNLKDVFHYTNSENITDYRSVVPATTYDALCRGEGYDHWGNSNAVNAFYGAYDGKRNYNGQPLIDRYGYLEGRASTSDYGTLQTSLYFRGFVKNAYCGVTQERATAIFEDPLTGHVIMSTGDNRWQGMRIA